MIDPTALPRPLDTLEYLGTTFEPADRLAILLRNPQTRRTQQRITTAAAMNDRSFQGWLRLKNDREGFDVYVGMNPLRASGRRRTKENILNIRHLYVDLDQNGAGSLAAIKQSNLVPGPNYVLSTSPDKFQVIWRVEGIAQVEAEALLRAMARKFGGDPAATDSTRVLRVPGFANKKYNDDFLVKADHYSRRIHHATDFQLPLGLVGSSGPALRHRRVKTVAGKPRPLSQSEHDWAFAKRALARGINPDEVIGRIAEFRAGEKSNTLNYARLTVLKAQAELGGRSSFKTASETDPT
jgi:hypothetical protein